MNQDFSKIIRALENVTLNRIKHEWWNRNMLPVILVIYPDNMT